MRKSQTRKKSAAVIAAMVLGRLSTAVHASIGVEEIEEYENAPPTNPVAGVIYNTNYAPIHFQGNAVQTVGQYDQGGAFPFQTFHALDTTSLNSDYSNHGYFVGNLIYGLGSSAYPFVSDIYCDSSNPFLSDVVKMQNSTGVAAAPGDFADGVKVVNCSWSLDFEPGTAAYTSTTDTDILRRIDSMINTDNVTYCAAGVTSNPGTNDGLVSWAAFNALACVGTFESFDPRPGIGKQHADFYQSGYPSFAAATASDYAVVLYAQATAAGQNDAMQNVVNRSMLMAGADKTGQGYTWTDQTTNHLDVLHGAGTPNLTTSLTILQAGEKSLLNVSGGMVTGIPTVTPQGWSYGTIAANSQTALLVDSSTSAVSLTASLNWNIISNVSGGNIDTTDAGVQFPNLRLELRSVTQTGSNWVLGPSESDPQLHSSETGDNVLSLYYTGPLPAGNYAFVITGDSSIATRVGFSYSLAGSFATQWSNASGGSWGNSANWTAGPAGVSGAVVNLLPLGSSSPTQITLDGNRTAGVINFNNSAGYILSGGTGGTLTLDDTSDTSGTVFPFINVTAGNNDIQAPINMAHGMNINLSTGTSLTLSDGVSGGYYIISRGAGTLVFNSAINVDATGLVNTLTTITPAGSLVRGPTYINAGATLSFLPPSGGLLVRDVGVPIIVYAGGVLNLAPAGSSGNRQMLWETGGLVMTGSTDNWQGKVDLNNNDMDLSGTTLADITNQIHQGFNNGSWNGTGGIVSSSAAADTTHLTALGAIENNQNGSSIFTADHPFDTVTPASMDVLVKYTWFGDANLDGKVDGSDYSLIDNGSLQHLTGWYNGDFNYDGVIDGSDYTLIDNAFNSQGASISTEINSPAAVITNQLATVPEPAGIATIGLGVLGLRRRKPSNSRGKPLAHE